MASDRLEVPHAAGAEPLPEAVDEGRAALRLIGTSAVGASSACFGSMRSGTVTVRLSASKPKPASIVSTIARAGDRRGCDVRGAAGRHRQADVDRYHLAVDAVEGKL